MMDHENVPEQQRGRFQMLYESVFNEALNTKRSSCEQSGGKIVRNTIDEFELTGEDFFTMNEISKLRRATTERKWCKPSIGFLEHSWNACAQEGIGESRR